MKEKILVASFFTVVMLTMPFTAIVGQADVSVVGEKLKEECPQGTATGMNICCQFMNTDQAELPEWSIGDFWEYNMTIYLAGVISIDVRRMEVRVTEITEDEYALSISGYLEGFVLEFTGYDYSELIPAKFVSGYAHIDKSTLAMKDYTLIISGNLQGILTISFDIELKMEFEDALDFFDFPISLNEDPWNIATNVNFIISGNVNFNGQNYPIEYELLDNSINKDLSVVSKEVITVPSGDFESFLITGQGLEAWYSSEIGYLAKLEGGIFLGPVSFVCDLKGLISTNFTNPDNNAPDIPDIDGPTSGEAGEEYEYTISTTDPNGEQVYYKIDWGDGACSGWLGPYPSDDEVIVKHTWTSKATYKIRAKAKDVNGYQTAWSDPMEVTMPVNMESTTTTTSATSQSGTSTTTRQSSTNR